MTKIQHKILALLVLTVALSLATTLIIVQQRVSRQVQDTLAEDLDARFGLIATLLQAEQIALEKQTILLAEEPTLKMSLETGDAATVLDTSHQLQSLIREELFLVTSDEGELMAKLPASVVVSEVKSSPLILNALEGEMASSIWLEDGGVYLVVGSPIEFNDFIAGSVICGKLLGQKFVSFLQQKSSGPVSVWSGKKLLASSWGPKVTLTQSYFQEIEGQSWMGKVYPFEVSGQKISIMLQGNYSRALAGLREISQNLAILGIAILLLAIVFSWVFSEQLTRPIQRLMSAVTRVSEGDFEQECVVKSNDELGKLGHSFEVMRQSLIEQRRELIRTEAMKKDLELASRIQRSLLPRKVPECRGVELDCKLVPSSHVGGDYYGFFQELEDGFGCVIADVSGHGTASALLMAMARSILLSRSELHSQPAALLQEVNRWMYPDLEEAECFISMFCFLLQFRKLIN